MFEGGVVAILLGLISLLIGLAAFAFWLWMLIHSITNKGLTDGERIVWVIVILVIPFIGSIIYFFIGKPKSG